jgi:S-layer protein
MSLTTAQLVTDFTNVDEGVAPDAATQLLLAAYSEQSIAGSITDAAALNLALHIAPPADGSVGSTTPENTTDVALGIYQFFTGMAPTLGGLDYLVNNDNNTPLNPATQLNPNSLDSAYYAGFNQANRYYNFAINLITGNAAAAATFAAGYGSPTVSFNQAITAAYETIIGTPPGEAAAIAAIEAQLSYFQSIAAARAPTVNLDVATKAIAIAYIIEEAIKADVGFYAVAIDQFNTILAGNPEAVIPGETANGIDLLTAFSGAGQIFTLTPGVDIITPPATNNNIVNGTELTLNSFDNIDLSGTTGNVLNFVDNTNFGGFEFATHFGLVVNGVQTANFSSKEAIFVDTTTWGGLDTLNIVSFRSGTGDTVLAGPNTAVNVNDTVVENSTGLSVTGGSVDTIVQTNGAFDSGDLTVNGGSGTTTVNITQTFTTGSDSDININDYFATIANVTLNGLDENDVFISGFGSVGLSNLAVSNAYYSDIFIESSGSPGVLNLSVNNDYSLFVEDSDTYGTLNVTVGAGNGFGFDGAPGGVNTFLDPSFSEVTTETVTGGGTLGQESDNMISLESIVISGAAGFVDFTLANLGEDDGNLVSVDASASSGPIAVTLDANLTSFLGGAGTDFVVVFEDATVPIAGGTAGNNEIVFNEPGANLTGGGTYANVTGFEILGTAWNSSGTYNLEGFSSPGQISTVDVRFDPAGPLTFTGAAVNQTLMVDASITSPITLVQGPVAAAGSHNTLNLVLGVNGGAANFDVNATDGIDTSVLGSGSAFTEVGFPVSVPLHPGATTLSEADTAGKALLADTWQIDITTAAAGGKIVYTDSTDSATVTQVFANSIGSQQAATLAADINTVDGAVHATSSGNVVTVTSLTAGAGGDVTLTAVASAGEADTTKETQKGQNATVDTGVLTVTNTDNSSQNELRLQITDGNGVVHTLAGFVDLTINESATTAATAIAALMKADGYATATAVSNQVDFTYLNVGDHNLAVSTDTVPQVDNISLAGVTGNISTEQFEITVNGPAFTGGAITFISTLGDSTITAVLNDLAHQFNTSLTYVPGATVSGDTLTLTAFSGQANNPFTDSGILESVFSPFFVPVGGQAITANNYQTLNLSSDGLAVSGVNTSYVVDNALASLIITGAEDLNLATSGGQHLATIDTTGASGSLNLLGVNPSEVTTGIHATLGDASVEMFGNADTGFTDTVTGGNGTDIFAGTGYLGDTVGSGGNSIVHFGDGGGDIIVVVSGGNTLSVGNGAGDIIETASSGNSTITMGNGAGDVTQDVGSGNNVIHLGNGAGDAVGTGTGMDTVVFGTGSHDTIVLSDDAGGGSGIVNVTFGGALATLDLSDVVTQSFLTPTTTSQVDILTNNVSVVTGLAHGDTIALPVNDTVVTGVHNMAGVAGEAIFTTGTYSGGGGTFTEALNGHDALLTYDSGGGVFVSVVLVGGAAESAHAVNGGGDNITF